MTRRRASSRQPTEVVDKTLEEILEGENVGQILAALSPSERKLLDQLAAELRSGQGSSEQLDRLWLFDYVRKPPSIQEFLEDPYWLGNVAMPSEDNIGMWPTWKEIFLRDWDLDSRIQNCVITGSLGGGKTWAMVVIMLYRLTLTSLLRNPTNFVGLSAGSRLIYVLMSVTSAQVKDTAFGDAIAMMARSPYFLEELHFDPSSKYSGNVIDLGPCLQLNAGSKSQHIIGRNTLGVGMDEGNYRLEANPDAKAYKLYNEVRTRIRNRFQKTSGFLPAISIIASSARDESSFTESVITEIMQKDDPKTEVVYRLSIYKMRDGHRWRELKADERHIANNANHYSPVWFRVAHGLRNVAPTILKGRCDRYGNQVGAEPLEAPPNSAKIELVPGDYYDEYARDTLRALQNLSGISIGGSYRLFTSTVDIEWCVDAGEKAGLKDPCTVSSIPLSEEDDREIWDFLDHPTFLRRVGGVVQPKRHPYATRFVHMDLATRSQAGISICHQVGWRDVEGLVGAKGQVFNEQRLIVEYDFVLSIISGRVKPISFEKLQKFIIWLRDRAGYKFGLITADTFQSFMQLQMLESRGFTTGSLSLDRTKLPYYSWRAGFEEHRILTFRHPKMIAEAEKLIDGVKVDHPTEGPVTSKDVSDSAAGAYFNCVSNPGSGTESLESPSIQMSSDVVTTEIPPVEITIDPVRRAPRQFRS